jgi:hypothetical protein
MRVFFSSSFFFICCCYRDKNKTKTEKKMVGLLETLRNRPAPLSVLRGTVTSDLKVEHLLEVAIEKGFVSKHHRPGGGEIYRLTRRGHAQFPPAGVTATAADQNKKILVKSQQVLKKEYRTLVFNRFAAACVDFLRKNADDAHHVDDIYKYLETLSWAEDSQPMRLEKHHQLDVLDLTFGAVVAMLHREASCQQVNDNSNMWFYQSS